MSSILQDTKKSLGIAEADTAFDHDVIMHVNNAFSNLNDIGIGPEGGFVIEGADEEWEELFPGADDPLLLKVILSKVKSYVYLKTRLIFDPPATPVLMTSIENQIREHEWRLSVNREAQAWVNPAPPDVLVIDGGDPSGD